MRSALIGVGRWGRKLAPAVAARSQLSVVCNRTGAEGARWLAAQHPHARHATDVAAVLVDPSIDVVFIATPMETHATLARKALENGKHVFVEKPLALDGAEARELADLAERAGLALRVGHLLLHHPAFAFISNVLENDSAVTATMTWTKLGTFDSDPWWNLGSHFASLALAIFGQAPVNIRRHEEQRAFTERDVVAADFLFAGNRACSMFIDRCAPRTARTVRVVTRSGRVLAWVDDEMSELVEQSWRPIALELGSALDRQLDDFFMSFAGSSSPTPLRSDGRHGAATVDLVARILATGPS